MSRALEVHELTGEPMSAWQGRHGFSTPQLRARLVALSIDSGELTNRITQRAHKWLDTGWIEEVRDLVDAGYGRSRAMASVGYREVRAFVEAEVTGTGAEGAIARDQLEILVVRSTRIFARRQRTWLHHGDVTWL